MLRILKHVRSMWPARIRYQLICGVALVHLLLMTIFVFDLVGRQREFLKEQSLEASQSLAQTLAVNSTSLVLANDVVGLAEIILSARQCPGLRYAMVVTSDGQVLAHTDRACVGKFVNDDISQAMLTGESRPQTLYRDHVLLDVAAPVVTATGRTIAWARIGQGQDPIWSSLRATSRDGLLYTLLAIAVGSGLAVLIGNRLTAELSRLLFVSSQIRDGRRDLRMAGSRTDEVSNLGAGINEMLEAITSGEREREALIELLHLLNTNQNLHALMHSTSALLGRVAECQAVGIRLRDGEDFPYFETRGFSDEFVHMENRLCAVDDRGELVRDSAGNPVLECMCGNILCRRFDPTKPFFTVHGSFWTNCTTELLAGTTEAERQSRTRSRCNGEGYESVALLPLRVGEATIGLLQFNDHRPGRFTPEKIAMLERFAGHLAIGLAHRRAEAELRENEERYRTVADFTRDWEYWIAPDGTLRYCSPACERITGYAVEEFMCDPRLLAAVVHPDDSARVMSHLCEVPGVATAAAEELEYRICRTDGEERWIAHVCQPVHGRDGAYLGRRASNRDVTARKRAEAGMTLRDFALDNVHEAVFLIDRDARLHYVNGAACRSLGYTRDELLGLRVADFDPDFPTERWSVHWDELKARRSFAFESRLQTKDGRLFPVEINANYFEYDGQGYNMGLGRDITERKRVERVNAARLRLMQLAATHSLDELLEATLNEAEELTGSLIGFYHFVEADQQTLSLQNWSTRTKAEFCRAEGKGLHYAISNAGVWVDCVHQRRPVIHNDYASLPHRKGTPPGHVPVVRELVVPVLRGERIMAILGVGNKPQDYAADDVETISLLAYLAWEIAERKRAEEELRRIEWLLTKPAPRAEAEVYTSPYGDLSTLNTARTILDSVGQPILRSMAGEFLDVLSTSGAIYEKNGDYALGIFSSGWCRLLDHASRELCGTDDNKAALASGKWLCHESCWTGASKAAVQSGKPVDIECNGGLHLYAVPIVAGSEVIGAINVGYGDPPRDPQKIREIAERYHVSPAEATRRAGEYESRPPHIVEVAKKRLHTTASLIGEIVERKRAEEKVRQQLHELQRWYRVTLAREGRVLELKQEVNRLLHRLGESSRYTDFLADRSGMETGAEAGDSVAGVSEKWPAGKGHETLRDETSRVRS